MRIEKGATLTLENNFNYNEVIENYGTLRFNPERSVKITNRQNIINYGRIEAKPARPSIKHEIQFVGVDMTRFVGNSMVPLASDVGLWNMAAGYMDIEGGYKKPYTRARGGIPAGAKSFPVEDLTGWEVGDEIVINPTDMPQIKDDVTGASGCRFWDSSKQAYVDNFIQKLERRFITGISGNTLSFDVPLKFDHNAVVTGANMLAPTGRIFTPYIQNLNRNVKFYGEANGRAHIFSCAHEVDGAGNVIAHHKQLHKIKNLEVFYMGPRKPDNGPKRIPQIVSGRYCMHFHHCGDGTMGSIIEGCSFHDNGNRCMVPHMANGITFRNNSVHNNLGEAAWWDFQTLTHLTTYENNLVSGVLWDGVQLGGTAFLLGIGSKNKVLGNTFIYANQGDPDGSGALQWTTDNESVWETDRNEMISCNNADWTWQNSGRPHAITRQKAVNCNFAVTHGAYGNMYIYSECEFYNAQVKKRASGSLFERSVFDGLNVLKNTILAMSSAVGGTNQFRECEFVNTDVGLKLDVFPHNGEFATPRTIDLVNNKYRNVKTRYQIFLSAPERPVPGCKIREQDGNNASQTVYGQGATGIGKFAPDRYGTGDGLKAEYFRGEHFEVKVAELVESFIRHDDWRIDLPKMPEGVFYTINTGPFSAIYSGKIEAPYGESYRFKVAGASGFRLWAAGQLLVDSPGNKSDNAEYAESKNSVTLTARQKYDFRIEVYDPGDLKRGVLVYWQSPSLGGWRDIDMSQLYSGVERPPIEVPPIIPPIENPPNMPNTANAGLDKSYTSGTKEVILDGAGSSGTITAINWYTDSGPANSNIREQNRLTTPVNQLTDGIYVFRLKIKNAAGEVMEDKVSITIGGSTIPDIPPVIPTKKTIVGVTITYSDATSVVLT